MMKKVLHLFLAILLISWTAPFKLTTVDDVLATEALHNYSLATANFVGRYGDPHTFRQERTNEGYARTATEELLFDGAPPRQVCPSMIGPFSDGTYYCTAREHGYCDRRSGSCFCNPGYQGLDCSKCQPSHYLIGNLCYSKKLCLNDCSNAGSCDYSSGICSCFPHRSGESCQRKLCSIFTELCSSCDTQKCLSCISGFYLQGASNVCSSCSDFDPRCAVCDNKEGSLLYYLFGHLFKITCSQIKITNSKLITFFALPGCTECIDPLLTSIRRSGYRKTDQQQPLEEKTRELSVRIPFG